MAFDITPGFSLGLSDLLRKSTNSTGSFQGSSGNKLKFSNPKGQSKPKSNYVERKSADDGEVLSEFTETPPSPNNQGGGDSSTNATAEDIAYYNDQENRLRGLLGRTQNTLRQGLDNLTDSYNREVSGANQQRSRALEDFGVQRGDTVRAKQEAIGQVDTNARTLNDSLRRILGMAAGSDSSAYQYAAPNAVAREASGERNEVLSDYAENDRNISLAERRAKEDFASLLDDLARQRSQEERGLRAGVLESEQDLNAQLGQVAAERARAMGGGYSATRTAQRPFESAINERQSQLDSLFDRFRNPMLKPKAVNVQTPQLRDYMVDRANIGGQTSPQEQYSPYSNFLRRNLDEEL